MGTWEGLRRAEILARSADDAARHHQWEADPTCAPPGGESLAAVQARVVACVRDLAERHAGAAVVLVSHVGPIKALLCTAMDVPIDDGATAVSGQCHGECDGLGGPCSAVGGSSYEGVQLSV